MQIRSTVWCQKRGLCGKRVMTPLLVFVLCLKSHGWAGLHSGAIVDPYESNVWNESHVALFRHQRVQALIQHEGTDVGEIKNKKQLYIFHWFLQVCKYPTYTPGRAQGRKQSNFRRPDRKKYLKMVPSQGNTFLFCSCGQRPHLCFKPLKGLGWHGALKRPWNYRPRRS